LFFIKLLIFLLLYLPLNTKLINSLPLSKADSNSNSDISFLESLLASLTDFSPFILWYFITEYSSYFIIIIFIAPVPSPPPCACGSPRCFELQLMPALLTHLRASVDVAAGVSPPLDWCTAAVFSCAASCEASREEHIVVLGEDEVAAGVGGGGGGAAAHAVAAAPP
jgi:hypothetical protein